eukprot:1158968-Pelagomonas_calceolata.AAC.6
MNHEGKILHLCNQDLRLGQPRAQASEEQSFEAAHGLLFNGGQMNQHHDKLNVYEIDAVKDALRAAIEEEKMYLMEDIDYLTALLTDEADMRVCAGERQPLMPSQLQKQGGKYAAACREAAIREAADAVADAFSRADACANAADVVEVELLRGSM